MIAGTGDLLIEATELSSRLNVLLDAVDPAGVERTSRNLERASSSLSTALGDNRDDLRAAIRDFRAAARDLRSIAEANKDQVGTSLRNFDDASRKLSGLADQLSTTAASMQRVGARGVAGGRSDATPTRPSTPRCARRSGTRTSREGHPQESEALPPDRALLRWRAGRIP